MHKQIHTAILLFAESPKRSCQKKLLNASTTKNFEFVQKLNNKALKTAYKSGLDVITVNEEQQQGADFGEKLSNAIAYVLDLGYDRVIVIGNDCPDLKSKDLIHANKKLETADMILGPDLRGGAYLIGINKVSFDVNSFKELFWQRAELRDCLISYANSLDMTISWLSPKADFNSEIEVDIYWEISSGIRILVNQLVDVIIDCLIPQTTYSYLNTAANSRRGPPEV